MDAGGPDRAELRRAGTHGFVLTTWGQDRIRMLSVGQWTLQGPEDMVC